MSWRALLHGDDRRHARAAVDAILAGLPAVTSIGLGGAAGQAILHAYAAAGCPDPGPSEARAAALLDDSVAGLDGAHATGLWRGLAGVRFAVAHLAGGDMAADALAAIDAVILDGLDAWRDRYDLMDGLCGIAVAALEGGGACDAIALRVLDHLE